MTGCSVASIRSENVALQGASAAPIDAQLPDLVPAQSLPARDEELWIIEKPEPTIGARTIVPGSVGKTAEFERLPGGGMLLGIHNGMLVPLPLEHTDVRADIAGLIASVDVHQRFTNSAKELADVVYAFPLPQNAAVNEFILSIGKRHIRAIVRERAEAEKIYREAQAGGFLASLMVMQGPNLFVQRVANLEPGAKVDVELRYFHTISCRNGWCEYEFPMIAGLRGDGLPRPEQRSGKDISLTIHLNAGVPIEGVECQTHTLAIQRPSESIADATLESGDKIPNRDLLLRYKLAGDGIKSSLITENDKDGGTFALTLVPPATTTTLARRPLEIVIVKDSTVGAAGNAAALAVLHSLAPTDTFQIVRADGTANVFPVPARPQTIDDFADDLSRPAPNGTTTTLVLRDWLHESHEPGRLRVVCYITDGHMPLRQTLASMPHEFGSSRIIVIGVGLSPNRPAIEAIARAGRGAAIYPTSDNDAAPYAREMIDGLSHPALSDIEFDWNGANVSDVFPQPSADLIVGHALLLTGRYHGPVPNSFTIRGKSNGQIREWKVTAQPIADLPGRAPLASLWARRKIADLTSAAVIRTNPTLDQRVRELSLEYGLVSRYTGFIVVDAITRTAER